MANSEAAPNQAVVREVERLRRELTEHNERYYVHDAPTHATTSSAVWALAIRMKRHTVRLEMLITMTTRMTKTDITVSATRYSVLQV